MNEMDLLRLGDSLELLIDNRGKNPKFVDSGIPTITAMSVSGGALNVSNCRYVDVETWQRWMPQPTRRGDVILTTEAPLGRTSLVPSDDPFLPTQRVICMRGKPNLLDSRFLYYSLQTSRVLADLHGRATGTTVVGIRQSALLDLAIPAPSFANQRAIADVLGALDEKISINKGISRSCESLRSALVAGATRSGTSAACSLSELTSLLTRGIAPSYTEEASGVRILNQKCVRDHSIDEGLGRKTEPSKVRQEKMLVPNDLIINSTGAGTLGRAARWTSNNSTTVDSHITIVRFDPSIVDPAVAGVAALALEPEIEAMAEGSTGQTELSRSILGSLEIRLPDRSGQGPLSHKIAGLDSEENAIREEARQLASLRDTLLPHLMSGRLRVKDAEKQVEAVV